MHSRVNNFHFINKLRAALRKCGIPSAWRKPKIIVSLTSYPKRITYAAAAIETLLDQSKPADLLLLWLSEDEFPNKEADLPAELVALTARGLEIRWCRGNLKPHKKYYYTMRAYPNDIVITTDDDLLYPPDLIETLYAAYEKHPDCVCAMRCHLPTFDEDGQIEAYAKWKKEYTALLDSPSLLLFATGVGGVLYPPYCMHPALFRADDIQALCPEGDDLWLKVMQVMAGTKTVLASAGMKLNYVPSSQSISLWSRNMTEGNDRQLKAILEKYDAFFGEQDRLTARMQKDAVSLSGKETD